ncbi:hypothetical protein ACLB2K_020553 [Fragaria x ananassa]
MLIHFGELFKFKGPVNMHLFTDLFQRWLRRDERGNGLIGSCIVSRLFILDEDNRWRTRHIDVGCVFVEYYRKLFTSEGSDVHEGILQEVAGRVAMAQATKLSRPFTRGEIETALKEMGPTKSPGPDGTVADLNHTLIALILKIHNPKKRFTELLMECVQSISYSALIQGRPFGRIVPSQGLRQGDPISPYLFLLVAEGFSSLLRIAERERLLHGAAITRGAPVITHLFFADDSLLFGDASAQECKKLKEIFEVYERSSGQKINVDKSTVCFCPRTTMAVKEACSETLDMKIVPCHERYLGLPMVIGRSKKLFKGLADRVW